MKQGKLSIYLLLTAAVMFLFSCTEPDPPSTNLKIVNFEIATVVNTSAYENENLGDEAMLRAQNWTTGGNWWVTRGFVKPDLSGIPPGSIITNATLRLRHYISPGEDFSASEAQTAALHTIEFHAVKQNWSENTITWNNQPEVYDTNFAFQYFTPQTAPFYKSSMLGLDVTEVIKKTYASGKYGFRIKLRSETENKYRGLFFGSDDCPDQSLRPLLEVTYYIP